MTYYTSEKINLWLDNVYTSNHFYSRIKNNTPPSFEKSNTLISFNNIKSPFMKGGLLDKTFNIFK